MIAKIESWRAELKSAKKTKKPKAAKINGRTLKWWNVEWMKIVPESKNKQTKKHDNI